MFSVLIATCSSDLIATLRGGPYNAVTKLRVNPSCKPSFLEVHRAQPWECSLVPCTWSPLAWPFHGSYLSQGSPNGGVGTSRVRLPPTSTRTMALKPHFPPLHYCSEVLRPLAVSPPPRFFLPMSIGG